jgi:hypothetical protein
VGKRDDVVHRPLGRGRAAMSLSVASVFTLRVGRSLGLKRPQGPAEG